MSLVVDAIYENGILRPLGPLDLPERQQVRVTVEVVSPRSPQPSGIGQAEDPLAEVRVATGVKDLAEHFDDYRFGRRRP